MSNGEVDKIVRITLDTGGMPIANPDPVKVKKDKEKVKWSADFQFTITIAGSSAFSSSANGNGGHDAKSRIFSEPGGTKLKYSITANGVTNDPEIDVEP